MMTTHEVLYCHCMKMMGYRTFVLYTLVFGKSVYFAVFYSQYLAGIFWLYFMIKLWSGSDNLGLLG